MHKNKKGFTLIEMLIVVAIIAILSGLILTGLSSARKQARDARRMSDLANIASQLEVYFNANNTYVGATVNPTTDPLNVAYGIGTAATAYCLQATMELSANRKDCQSCNVGGINCACPAGSGTIYCLGI